MKFEYSWKILEKYPNIRFHENESRGSRVVPFGQTDERTIGKTDMAELIVTFLYLQKRLKQYKSTCTEHEAKKKR